MSTQIKDDASLLARFSKTRFAYFWMYLVDEPFLSLFALMSFILRKDLGASAFQLAVLVTVKPVISVFSFYWSANLSKSRKNIVSNLTNAWILARLPFLFFPFINNIWFLIFSVGVYQLFYRAGIPAMIEILKLNMTKPKREKIFSLVYVLSFAESICLGIFVGKILDFNSSSWKMLFSLFAFVSLSSIYFLRKVTVPIIDVEEEESQSLRQRIVKPWQTCIHLMRSRPDFARFQWGFMFGGVGLMIMAPALAIYYAENLSLSHENITIGRYIWMGCGILLSTYFWKRALSKVSTNIILSWILIGFSIFAFVLLFAKMSIYFLYLSFFVYGVAQAGSHLLWNLSGTLFSGDGDSTVFSGINILMVGIRGAVAPFIGGVLCYYFGPVIVLIIGAFFCITGVFYMLFKKSVPFEVYSS
jgi:hypothetical protein